MSGTFPTTAGPSNGFAQLGVNGSGLTTPLMSLLVASGIEPGDNASYQLCKEIFLFHPLGGKIVEAPIRMAQSQRREITVGTAAEKMLVKAFEDERMALRADENIAMAVGVARTYGVSALACGERKKDQSAPLNLEKLAEADIYFSIFDPLNTSGSITLDQDPNSPTFQKPNDVKVQGVQYHRSRIVVTMNEAPVYLAWTASAYGYTGRSVYQRALYPLKSFIQTMITDDMISRKAGLLIAMLRQPGSIINAIMQAAAALKRVMLQLGQTDNVLSIATDEKIETLNMMNVDGAGKFSRDNIIKNIATAVPMPARWITEDSLAEGFGEGSEDAKAEKVYVDRMREEMAQLYNFMDVICMHRAWSPAFYKTVQELFPAEFGGVDYQTAFQEWKAGFKAEWPNFLVEPDSEKSKAEKVKFDAMVQLATLLLPQMDPVNKGALAQWIQDNTNAREMLFPVPLQLDIEALMAYTPPQPMAPGGEGEGDDKAKADSVVALRAAA